MKYLRPGRPVLVTVPGHGEMWARMCDATVTDERNVPANVTARIVANEVGFYLAGRAYVFAVEWIAPRGPKHARPGVRRRAKRWCMNWWRQVTTTIRRSFGPCPTCSVISP